MSTNRKVKFKDIVKSDTPVLVDFYATWCGPCKQLSPIVNSLKGDLEGKMKVIKIDVDKNKNISSKYSIKSLPTLAIFKNGEILWRDSGMKTKSQLLKIANQYIDKPSDSSSDESSENKSEGSWFSRIFS